MSEIAVLERGIDLVVEMAPRDADAVARAFSGDDDADEDAVKRAAAERGMFSLIHLGEMVEVDLIVRNAGEYRSVEFARRREIEISGIRFFIVAPEDLPPPGTDPPRRDGDERDTSPEAARIFHEMLMSRTADERLLMASDMFDAAREPATAGLRAEGGADLRVRLFLRSYGSDFDPVERGRIAAPIRRYDAERRSRPGDHA